MDRMADELEKTGRDLTLRLGTISEQLAELRTLYGDASGLAELDERTAALFIRVPIKMLMTAATLLMCISTPAAAQQLNAALESDKKNLYEYAKGVCDVMTSILEERDRGQNAGPTHPPSVH